MSQMSIPALIPDGVVPEGGVAVWVEATDKDDLEQVWLKGFCLAQSGPLATIRLAKNNQVAQYDLRKVAIELANPPNSNNCPPDVTALHYINESSILESLGLRSLKDEPYTFIGPVLVAVNPLKRVEDPPGMLGTAKASEQPHPYAVAEGAYSQMSFASDSRRTNKIPGEIANQSVVASGESGAGKTESAKMVLRHLVSRTSGGSSTIDKRLLGSNPITEAFGNASTLRNENSSRFGKFMRLHFEQDLAGDTTGPARWVIRGASVRTYLLERSRVTLHEAGERNFHVFYQLLNGADASRKSALKLNETKEWRYLRALGGPEAPASALLPGAKTDESRPASDQKDYEELLRSFASLGFSDDEVEQVFRVIAGVLHLGNVQFDNDESTTEGEIAVVQGGNKHLEHAASMFSVSSADLNKVLTERKIEARGETTVVKKNATAAAYARDAIAKGSYSSLFDFLIRRIDKALDDSAGGKDVSSMPFVGVLDIFGFESFVRNGFEQLLINFANEALQATFNRSVFIAEAELYKAEGLTLDRDMEPPPDNSSCMQLLMGGGNVKLGLLSTVDAQAQVPQANDSNMTNALHREFGSHQDFPKPHPKDRSSQFLIRHYAGAVSYTVQAFVEKNNDKLPSEVGALFRSSSSKMIAAEMFQETEADKKKARSVVAKFTGNIKDLIETLEATKVSFIRCVKPNAEMKRAGTSWFNRKYVSMQLRCLSVPQTAAVLRSGLPTRIPYSVVSGAYKANLPEDALAIWKKRGQGSDKTFTAALFWAFEVDPDSYRLGFSKVFFKSGKLAQLDHIMQAASRWSPEERQRVGKRFKLYYIRAMWRQAYAKVRAQNAFKRLFRRAKARSQAALKIQAFMRMVPHRKRFLKQYKQAQVSKQKAKEEEDKSKREAERAEKRRQEEEAREKEMQKQIEAERLAMDAALAQAKKEALLEREQQEKLKAEREEAMARATTAEQKRAEAEKLHRQALAAQILAEAAAAEQRAYEEELRKGRQLTDSERARALEKFEQEYAAQMARYEARRKYYGNLQAIARRELTNYNQKIMDFLESEQVKQLIEKAKVYVDVMKEWALLRLQRVSTAEGRQVEAEAALAAYRATAEQARQAAAKARAKLHEQLKEYHWYQRAMTQRARIQQMAKEFQSSTKSGSRNRVRGGDDGKTLVVDRDEWVNPVVSANNQAHRLRVLLDAGHITPDEYARLVGEVLDSVENTQVKPDEQHRLKKQSVMGIQMTCSKCGKECNTAAVKDKRCPACKTPLVQDESEKFVFEENEGWTVPLACVHGEELRARISGTETVLDPNTFVETRLFVVELCYGDGGRNSVFWRVAHPFSDFVHIHREITDAKSSYVTKDAKEKLPTFPQAEEKHSQGARRQSLLSFFGSSRRKSTAPKGAGVLLSPAASSSTLLRVGEQFLREWLKGVFSAVESAPAKADKTGENPFLKFKPIEVFLHISENVQ